MVPSMALQEDSISRARAQPRASSGRDNYVAWAGKPGVLDTDEPVGLDALEQDRHASAVRPTNLSKR